MPVEKLPVLWTPVSVEWEWVRIGSVGTRGWAKAEVRIIFFAQVYHISRPSSLAYLFEYVGTFLFSVVEFWHHRWSDAGHVVYGCVP